MLITHNFAYYHPSSVSEVLPLLGDGNMIIAGGSDVLPQLKTATISPSALVDLGGIEELKKTEEQSDGIHIGSMAVLSHLAKNPLILKKLPALSQAARNVASPQIRNRGTIAGNILQARRCFYYNQTKEWRKGIKHCYKVGGDLCLQIPNSPVCRAIYYSDIAPVLMAYDTKVVTLNRSGNEQTVNCYDLIEAHCKDEKKDFLIKEFFIPRLCYEGTYSKFIKYSLRGSIDFPVINFAGSCGEDFIRIFVGAIATHVIELTQTESLLKRRTSCSAGEILNTALEEMKTKSQIIREAGISPKVKRGTFCYVKAILDDLGQYIK